ncbi:ABC transporter [Sphingobacterium haloxyli]|uniref:ABC transporter n=2 Tax=Sphingobacterium haloxyli TaxID=2100533 RepID=A0A2S9IVQ6_9SPHI|nr:ABC transporter [Sphingobacterium haloxyli]
MSPGALGRLLQPVRLKLLAATLLSAIAAAAGLAPYIAIAEIGRHTLSLSSGSFAHDKLWLWVTIGLLGAFLRLLLTFFSSRIGHYADAEILHNIRVRIVRHLGILPLGWFRYKGASAVKKVMTNDLEEMHQLIAHSLRETVGAAVAILVGSAYLVAVDWRMGSVTISVLALMFVSYRIAMRSITLHMSKLLAAEARISSASVEYADGISVVKTFGTSGRMMRRFAKAVDEHTKAMSAWVSETKYSSALARLLASEMTVFGVVMVSGLFFVRSGSLAIGDLIPFLIVGIGLPTSIVPAIHGGQGLRKGRLSAGNIENLLNRKPLPEPSQPQNVQGHRIIFNGVSFAYDGHNMVLKNINMTCEPGTVTALVGPSGAGKSTLANLLPRFYDVTAGSICIGGVDIRSIPSKHLLTSMSLVFQDIVLLRDTVAENIRIGKPRASFSEIKEAAQAAQIHHVIEQLPNGYDTILGSGSSGLSGGERQRLTIARAILSGAPIVILDEATASLDPDSELAVQDALSKLASGKTMIVIAHRLHTIKEADQIVVIDRGQIVETGKHNELIVANGLYSRMWNAQQKNQNQYDKETI